MYASERVYLDHAATEKMLPCVKQAMLEAIDAGFGNASALHSDGHRAYALIESARAKIARLINAKPSEIVFTSGGTESNNTVMNIFRDQPITVSQIEHPSVLESARTSASQLTLIPVDSDGRVSSDQINDYRSVLFSVMLANNELGTLEPVSKLVQRCHKTDHRSFFHTDATQALGKIKIDVKALGVDYLTLSAHKIGGPLGVGALYVRQGAPFKSFMLGGHQESRRRAGTTNTLGIIGFGAAADWCWKNWSCKQWAKVAQLRDKLKTRILREIPYSSCNSPDTGCLPNILNVSFRAAEGESIQLYLDAAGIIVSTGSACAAGDLQPSHVIMATKNDAEVAHSSIRFSLGLDTTSQDIERVMAKLPEVVKRLQGMSTIKLGGNHEPRS